MLTVETFEPGGKNATTIEATRVVVKDEHGNPLVIAVLPADGTPCVSHFLDPEFEALSRALGYDPPHVLQVVPARGK